MKIKTSESDYYKWIKVGNNVEVVVQKEFKLVNREYTVGINWSNLGTKSIAKTENFYKELSYALEVARKEKRNHDKNK